MKKVAVMMVVAVAGVLLLVSVAAAAPICFSIAPFSEVLKLSIGASADDHINLNGEHIGTCGGGTSRPMNGDVHFQPSTNNFHVGTISHNSDAGCVPVFIQGKISAATLSGPGFFRNLAGGSGALTFAPVACPATPELLGGPAGTTTGTK